MVKSLIFGVLYLSLHGGTLFALADPSHEIEEASDKQELKALYRKSPSHCAKRREN